MRVVPLIVSKLTSKAQTTIPQPVRTALRREEGDEIAYVIEDGRVYIMRVGTEASDDPFGTFSEWHSDADRRSMATFEPNDVVRVPFPYTGRATRQWRPALVLAAGNLKDDHGLLWLAMITSADNRGWPGDVAVTDLRLAGLPAPSVVRTAKIATIEARDAQPIGMLKNTDAEAVAACVYRTLRPVLQLRLQA